MYLVLDKRRSLWSNYRGGIWFINLETAKLQCLERKRWFLWLKCWDKIFIYFLQYDAGTFWKWHFTKINITTLGNEYLLNNGSLGQCQRIWNNSCHFSIIQYQRLKIPRVNRYFKHCYEKNEFGWKLKKENPHVLTVNTTQFRKYIWTWLICFDAFSKSLRRSYVTHIYKCKYTVWYFSRRR